MKKILSSLSLLFLGGVLMAQQVNYTQNVRGKVLDSDSHMPIPGVNVVLLSDKNIGASTDFDGEFILENVPVGRQDIAFTFIGYKAEARRNLQIQSGKELYLEIEMTEMIEQLGEVTVKAAGDKSQSINRMATVSARSFNIEETEKYAGSLGDPSRMAQNFAGVLSAGDQRNDIIIRGNSPTGLLWQLDGIPIPNPNHFGAMGSTGGPVSMLNNNLLANSDFFTGAFPAEYGNALSGVFDLNMRTGNNRERQYVFQIGFNGFELGAEGPFSTKSNASYLLNYRYSTVAVMDMMGMDMLGGAVPEYQDISFKFNFPTKKAGVFTLSGMGGISEIVFDQEQGSEGSYNTPAGLNTRNGSDMGLVNLSHKYFVSEKTRIRTWASASLQQVYTKLDSLKYADNNHSEVLKEILYYDEQNQEIKIQAGTRLSTKFNAKNSMDFGVSYHSTRVSYMDSVLLDIDYSGNKADYTYHINTDIENKFLNILQAYAQWKHKFTNDLTLYTGLHSQYLDLNGSISAEPRMSLKYQISPTQTLSAGYGLHAQAQPGMTYFTQSLVDSVNKVYEFSNHDLDFTKSHQAVLSYQYMFTENLRFKTETYYQHLYNVPVNGYFSNLNFGAGFYFPRVDSLVNEGHGRNYGIEFTLEKFLSNNYYYLVTASLFDSQFENNDGNWRNTAFNNQFVVNALGGFEFPIKDRFFLNINLKAVVAGGNPLMAIDLETSEMYNTTSYDQAESYKERAPYYFRMDSRISLKVNGKHLSQEFALDLQNITDHQNVFNQEYFVNENGISDVRYNYQQGFFPMFLYRLNF